MNLSDITCCVVDHGLYLPVAQRLAKEYKRVLYHTPWEKGFPTIAECCVGDGFDDIERCDDFWGEMDDIDLFVFPDILHVGLQEHLREMGKPVWGSGDGSDIETNRLYFLELLQQTDLPMPTVVEVRGITDLRAHLKDHPDKYIKISKYRGTMETWHWRDWEHDAVKLDILSVKLGAVRELVRFLVFDPIDTDIEIGCDTYCIDGGFPQTVMEAYEWKDKSAFGAGKKLGDTADVIQDVFAAFGPILGRHTYRNHFSAEIRVADGQGYFIDPCCRGPLPMTFSQLELYGNYPEIVWAGANGELVEPQLTARYCCECILTSKVEHNQCGVIEVPDELRDAMKISRCCRVQGALAVPADESEGHELTLGWLVATGDTPRETVENQLEQVKLLPDGVDCGIESVAKLLQEIDEAESQGMEFSPFPTPPPSVVVES